MQAAEVMRGLQARQARDPTHQPPTRFFRGLGQKESFSQLVAGLYFVYDAMESEFTQTADEGVRKLDLPELRRVPSLETDIVMVVATAMMYIAGELAHKLPKLNNEAARAGHQDLDGKSQATFVQAPSLEVFLVLAFLY